MMRAWRPVVVALAAISFVLLGASANAQQDIDYFVAGVEKVERGEYDRAVRDLVRAVEQTPDSSAAWYYLGVAQFETVYQNLAGPTEGGAKKYDEADKAFARAAELAASAPGPRYYRGRIREEQGAYEEAKQQFLEELSVRLVGDPNKVRVAVARVSHKAGHHVDALELLKQVLESEPRYVEALYYTGLAQSATDEHEKAIETYKKGLKILNDWLDRVYRLLRLEYIETDPDKPEKASRIVENWDELRKELWSLREARARPNADALEQVMEEYKRAQDFALNQHKWPDMNKALGDAHLGLKDWSAARNAYRHAMKPREGEGSEEDTEAWARIGRAYFLNGKETFEERGLLFRAIDELKAAEGDQETDPEQWDGFARALYVAGIDKSGRLSDLRVPPEPDRVLAATFDGLAEVYLYQSNTYQTNAARGIVSHTQEDALSALNKALLFCPTYVPALLHKAQALISRAERVEGTGEDLAETMGAKPPEEDWEEYLTPEDHYGAAAELLNDQAIPLDPSNADLHAELSRAYVALDKLDEADKAAKQALALDKDHVLAHNMQGLVKYYRRQCVAAAQAFTLAIKKDPSDFQSYVNLGNALYGLQSWEAAQREYIRALERIPQTTVANTGSQRPYVLYLIARTQHEQKLYERAIETLEEALKLRTDFYDAQRLLAAAYSGLRKWRAAEEALRASLKTAPNDRELAGTHAHLGQVYEVQAQFQRAVAEYRMALAKHPTNMDAADGVQRLALYDRR